jgi:hypothetical protein
MAGTPVGSRTPERRCDRSPSRPHSRWPPRWVGRCGRSERRWSEVVVEGVAPAGNFPVLTKSNYYDWAALMHVMLQARDLWTTVSVGTTDYAEDCMALEVISKAVSVEMMVPITSKPTAKAAWESIKLRNVGVDRVSKAKGSTLKHKLDLLMLLHGESIDEFGARLGRITNQLAVLGFEYEEEEIVRRFLQALPRKFKQIVTSIETLLDLEMILIGRLKPTEERLNGSNSKAITSLNLTEDELVARLSSRLKILGNGVSNRSKEASSTVVVVIQGITVATPVTATLQGAAMLLKWMKRVNPHCFLQAPLSTN